MADEENQITFTKEAIARLIAVCPEQPSYRLKAEKDGSAFVTWLHWDDFKEKFDEEILIKDGEKQIVIWVDPDSFSFLAGGNTVVDYVKGLLMNQFVFRSDYNTGQFACGEPYEVKSR